MQNHPCHLEVLFPLFLLVLVVLRAVPGCRGESGYTVAANFGRMVLAKTALRKTGRLESPVVTF